MDEQFLHSKLDRMISDITDIKVVQAEQHITLEHHVKRCDILEAGQDILRDETAKAFSEIRKELAPLHSMKDKIVGASKLVALLLTLSGIILGGLKLFLHKL